ncbi:MAG: hypothetical protein M3O86_06505, partial [Actinomycetota bacterium]|nr:hypothetical protein [Actinomycetota bacterium]
MVDDATDDDEAVEPSADDAGDDQSDDQGGGVDDEGGEEADELTAGEGGADESAPATASTPYRLWRRARTVSR